MAHFKATQGLLVSWGGFTQPLLREGRQGTFKIALWDESDLVRNYDKIADQIQSELPLNRIWILVHENAESGE